jgi:hypothetical protein
MAIIVGILTILLIPSIADAWGPLTHLYLGYQILDVGAALIPAGIYGILKKYKNDYLYGNLSADIILGRRFQAFEKNSHNWNIAWKLLKAAKSDKQIAFAYGYLMHLCADTVVHNIESNGVPFSHSILEVKADSILDKKYRRMMKNLDKYMQKKHDVFLERKLESMIFSFKTNKRIFKGFLLLSRLQNYTPVSNFIDNRFPYHVTVGDIYTFRQESLERMMDLLNNGKEAVVLREHPLGKYQKKAS